MYLNARDFYLKSTWTGTERGGTVRYSTPSLAREYVTFSASQLPTTLTDATGTFHKPANW